MKIASKHWLWAAVAMATLGAAGCKQAETPALAARMSSTPATQPVRAETFRNLFPDSGAVSGWEKTSETRVFAPQDLHLYNDSDAARYVAAGVVSTATSDYNYEGKLEITVDVHYMGDAERAEKLFDTSLIQGAKIVSVGDGAAATRHTVVFRKGPYVVRLVGYQTPPRARRALLALARKLDAQL